MKHFLSQLFPGRWLIFVTLFSVAMLVLPLTSPGMRADVIPPNPTVAGGWVRDKANILSPYTEGQLNTMIRRLNEEKGREILVVTVPQTTPDNSPQGFANELFEQWGVNKSASSNGILLLISQGDQKVVITTGYGVEPILPDAKVSEILETHIVPHLKAEDFDTGVLNGTEALITAMTQPKKQFSLTLAKRQRLWLLSGVMAGISLFSYGVARLCSRPILLPTGNPPQVSQVKFVPPSQRSLKGDSTEMVAHFRDYLRALSAGGIALLPRSTPEQRFPLVPDFLYGTSWTGILALSFLVMSQGLGVMLILLLLPYLKLIPSAILKVKQQNKIPPNFLIIGTFVLVWLIYQFLHWLAWLIIVFPVVSAVFIAFPVAFTYAPMVVKKLKPGVSNKLTYLDAQTQQPLSAIAPDILNSYLSEAQKVTKRLGSTQYQGFCNAQGEIHLRAIIRDSNYQKCPHCQELTVSRSQQTLKPANLSSYGIRLVTLTCECCGYRTKDHQAILSNSRSGSYGSYGEGDVWGGESCGGGSSFGGGSFGGGSSEGGGTGGDF